MANPRRRSFSVLKCRWNVIGPTRNSAKENPRRGYVGIIGLDVQRVERLTETAQIPLNFRSNYVDLAAITTLAVDQLATLLGTHASAKPDLADPFGIRNFMGVMHVPAPESSRIAAWVW